MEKPILSLSVFSQTSPFWGEFVVKIFQTWNLTNV